MIIRHATLGDTDVVFELVTMLGSDSFSYEEFYVAYCHSLSSAHCLLAEIEGEAVGLGIVKIEYQLHHGKKMAEITELVVEDQYRAKGIGKALVEEMTRIATKHHCIGIEVASNQKRVSAHRFYQREGFLNTHYKLTKRL